MGIKEELEKFAKAKGINQEKVIGNNIFDLMINNFVSKVDGAKTYKYVNNEKLNQMMKEGQEILEHMIKDLPDTDVIKKFADEVLKKTEKVKTPPEKIHINWDDMTNAIVSNVAPKISEKFPDIDTILCITRGGLVPAGIMAYALNIKNIVNIKVESYDDNNAQKELKLTKLSKRDLKTLDNAKGILIVDDILDSGDTMVEVFDYLAYVGGEEWVDKTEVFTIVTKDYVQEEFCVYNLTSDERWIVFPWDK